MADTSLAGGDSITIGGGNGDSVTVGGGNDDSVTIGSDDSVTTGSDIPATVGGGDSVTISGGSTDTKESKDNIYEQDESGNYKKYDGIKDNIIDPVNDDLQVKKAKLKAQLEWIEKNIGIGQKTSLAGGVSVNVGQNQDGIFTLKTQEDSAVVNSKADNDQATTQRKQDPKYLDRRPAWIDTNIEYHRVKTADGISVDSAYIKRYYSVIDAEVYFGNEYVEDIHDINWSIKQNVTPLFGYNSYTYDEVARGNRLIVGNFLINFTSPNYLFSILKEADKANVTSITNMTSYTVPVLSKSKTPSIRKGTYGSQEKGHNTHMWPQTFDIDIIFGEKTGAGDPVHILLLGCAIQDCQMALSASASGSPPVIMERYNFIAQDIRTVVGKDTIQSTANSTASNSVTSAQSNNDSLDGASTDNTDLSSLSNLKVSNENKEMAEYYKEQQEKAKEKEAVKQAVNTAIANAKAAQINNEADKKAETMSKIHNVISSVTGEDISNTDNFVIRAKQVNGMLLTYMEGTDTASTKHNMGRSLSDDSTAVLLSRYDSGEKLSLQEKQDLIKKVRIAEAKGEWYFYNDDEQEYIAIPYNTSYNGQSKSGVVLFELDKDIDVSIFGSGSAFDS